MGNEKNELVDDENQDEKITRKKNKKDTRVVLIIFFALVFGPFIVGILLLRDKVPRQQDIEELVYEDDYASTYSEEIKIVFGPDCKVGDKKDITIEGESCGCGYHSDTYIYDEWEITYKDQYGQTFVQTMNNMESFEEQQIEWMTKQMEEHYKELSDGDSKERAFKKKLVERLSNPDNMISLHELDYSQVYKIYPIRLDIHLQIEDMSISTDEVSKYEKVYQEKLDKIAADILKESENSCHMDVLLSVTYNDSYENDYGVTIWEDFRCRSLYIAGEEVDMTNQTKDYNQLLLYWYNENIW